MVIKRMVITQDAVNTIELLSIPTENCPQNSTEPHRTPQNCPQNPIELPTEPHRTLVPHRTPQNPHRRTHHQNSALLTQVLLHGTIDALVHHVLDLSHKLGELQETKELMQVQYRWQGEKTVATTFFPIARCQSSSNSFNIRRYPT